jgi:hypothetical protein
VPDSGNPSSSWTKISPVPVTGDLNDVTAVYATGTTTTIAAQQGRAETVIEQPGS